MLYVWVAVLYEEQCCSVAGYHGNFVIVPRHFPTHPWLYSDVTRVCFARPPEAFSETCCFGQKRKLRGHGMNWTVDPSEYASHPILSSMMLARRCPLSLVAESVFGAPSRLMLSFTHTTTSVSVQSLSRPKHLGKLS